MRELGKSTSWQKLTCSKHYCFDIQTREIFNYWSWKNGIRFRGLFGWKHSFNDYASMMIGGFETEQDADKQMNALPYEKYLSLKENLIAITEFYLFEANANGEEKK